jgi:glycosyltransferase involved in cell wall biosynthesis
MTEPRMPTLTLIIPAYNEAAVLPLCVARISAALAGQAVEWSICFVDDGSDDASWSVITAMAADDPRITGLKLSRNFGKEAALTAGLDSVDSDICVIMDADLQDPPELLPQFIAKWHEGFDVVYGLRQSRRGDSWLKRTTAGAFYRLIERFADSPIPRNTGDFRLLSRRAVLKLNTLRERTRFMKGLFGWIGFPQVAVPYERPPRAAGSTKWNYWRLWNFALDGITSFTTLPLRIATYVGACTALFAFVYGVWIIVKTLIFGIDLPGYASIMVTMVFLGGLQLIALGIIGEYLGRLMQEVKQRPIYLLEQRIGSTLQESAPNPKTDASA